MQKYVYLTGLICLAQVSAIAQTLPTDPRLVTGRLENGVTWIYRQHDNPPGKMALMVRVDSGSLHETDAQRGLAHFLEHMVFNGSEHFKPGELIPYFESIGMEFGADLNAFTSFDQTAYMLFTPDTTEAQVDKALLVLSDFLFRATLQPEEIDKERNVILAEKRARSNVQQRMMEKIFPELFEGSLFAQRIPIGTEEVISSAPREQFMDYYRTWYRPDLTTVIVVGDAPAERIVPLIEKNLATARAEGPTRPAPSAGLKPFTSDRAIVVTDPDLATAEIEMYAVREPRPAATTVDAARIELIDSVATWILNRRYDERLKRGESSYRSASASIQDFFRESLLVEASAVGEPGVWERMLDELALEITRAREHGVQQRELELARTAMLANAEHDVRTAATKNARSIVFSILEGVNEREPVLSEQQKLDLLKELLPTVEIKDINEALAKRFAGGAWAFVLRLPERPDVSVPAREQLLAAARAAMAKKADALAESSAAEAILEAAPTPGKLVERTSEDDLGVTHGWLSNGVRIHHRYMDYKKDTVMVSVSLAGGQLEEKPENANITQAAAVGVNQPATSRLSSTQIRDLMTGKNISVRATVDADAFKIIITGSPQDLAAGLELAHAVLTDARIEAPGLNTWKQAITQQIEMASRMPEFQATKTLLENVSGHDPRISPPDPTRVRAIELADAQAWLDRLRQAPIEVAVVGDMRLEDAIPLVEQYIGSLPGRPRAADLDSLRTVRRATGPLKLKAQVETITPKSMVISGFVGPGFRSIEEERALRLATNILTSRLVKRVREELALVYGIGAQLQMVSGYEDFSLFFTGAPCATDKSADVIREIDAIFNDFAKNGPTAEELENARRQVDNNLDTQMKEPNYWWNALQHLDLQRRSLDEHRNKREAYQAISGDRVREVFAKFFVPERRFEVLAEPSPSAAPATQAPAESPTPAPAGAGG